MGFLDRWRRPSLEQLKAPWGARPSIHDHVRAHARADGSLPPDYRLPDEDALPEDELRWAPGALDGVMSHHAPPGEDARRAADIAASAIRLMQKPSAPALERLCALVGQAPLLACVDALVESLTRSPDLDADRLHALGRYLATRAADREVVKLGLTLLGLVDGTDDRDLLLTLGAHDDLTLFALVAVVNRSDFTDDDVWSLAKRARGWGRVQAVERLASTEVPEIQEWMLREGFRNEVMNEYLAYTCAVTGRLDEALAAPDVDEPLLLAAGEILTALVAGGPAQDLRDYAHGAVVSQRFLALLGERGELPLELLPAVVALRSFVDEEQDWDALAAIGWTPARRADVRALADRILARPDWTARIERTLDATDELERRQGEHLARLVGIDTWHRVQARLERELVDPAAWFELMRQCDEARIEVAVALAEQLPLAEIASGPAERLGLGAELEPHSCLDAVLQELGRYPGHGASLLRAGLESPVVRNRTMALHALAAWPRADWPEDAVEAIERLREREPVASVRELIDDVLAGRDPS